MNHTSKYIKIHVLRAKIRVLFVFKSLKDETPLVFSIPGWDWRDVNGSNWLNPLHNGAVRDQRPVLRLALDSSSSEHSKDYSRNRSLRFQFVRNFWGFQSLRFMTCIHDNFQLQGNDNDRSY